jgi:hypothetical protein
VVRRVREAAGSDSALVVPLLYDRAYVHLLLGERDSAVLVLEEWVDSKPRMRGYLAADVQMRGLRDHPRFRTLVTEARSSVAHRRAPG